MNGSGMKSATGPVFFILLFSLAYGTAEAGRNIDYDLNVNGIEINVKGTEPAVPKILEPRTEEGPRKWIVQFDGPINNKDKELVVRSGCRLIDYLPEFAFTASMDGKTKKAIETLPFVRGVVRFKPAYKLSGKLTSLATSPSDGEKIRLNVLVDDQANLHQALSAVHRLKGKVLNVDPTTLLVEMETTAIADLAREEEVIWIDEHIPLQIFNDTACWTIQSFSPAATKMWSKGLHGEGQVVGIADTGVDYDMPWFRDPLVLVPGLGHRKILAYDTTYGDDFDSNDPGHGTHVAGTAVGDRTPVDGRSDANGMAPKARLFFQDISVGASLFVSPPSDLGQLFLPTHESGARLHSNSWGNSSNLYGALAASVDRFVWDHQEFLPFFANGNNGPAIGTVGNPAVAKNIVSVGASHNGTEGENVAWFSSNGPTVDGRIKPTVMAPGYSMLSADSDGIKESYNSGTIAMSGTSMATPAAAGAAALVRQYFIEGYHPSGFAAPTNSLIPSGALVKAVLINSAQNMTGSDTDSSIPSTGQGWGRINLANSLTFAGDTKKMMMVDERMGLFTDGISSTAIVVGAGQPLKVSLVWADYPGAIGASKALVNDLDLLVTAPDGTVYLGNMLTNGESRSSGSADRLNVEEQVVISTPLPGFYTVTVHGYNVPFGPQPFAWVATSGFNVPSKGVISLDRRRYPTQGEIGILVADRDLDLDTGNVDQ
ncbi:MAG TPA: S8 family serine peptidase, partial [Geobacteraceae bacterium]